MNDLEKLAQTYKAELEELLKTNDIEKINEYINMCLGIHRRQYLSQSGKWVTYAFELERTTGGPNVTIEVYGRSVYVKVAWGGKEAEAIIHDKNELLWNALSELEVPLTDLETLSRKVK